MSHEKNLYRGRLAPSPTGYLHLGHARTFWVAQERARSYGGALILRNEDLDVGRSRPEYVAGMLEDLRWFGFQWQEGPDCGGPYAPYTQSERRSCYRAAFEKLLHGGFIYPCRCSRKDVLQSVGAPHQGEEEAIYPGTCRNMPPGSVPSPELEQMLALEWRPGSTRGPHWRFRVPGGENITFQDNCQGTQSFVGGKDFGDFVIWRHDGIPAYQLAVAVDDAQMHISEVVRGADLLLSTARQLLIYRALDLQAPEFYHCPLMTDSAGVRLAKRHDALSLRSLRAQGFTPTELREGF